LDIIPKIPTKIKIVPEYLQTKKIKKERELPLDNLERNNPKREPG